MKMFKTCYVTDLMGTILIDWDWGGDGDGIVETFPIFGSDAVQGYSDCSRAAKFSIL